jgi:hypothetical protein
MRRDTGRRRSYAEMADASTEGGGCCSSRHDNSDDDEDESAQMQDITGTPDTAGGPTQRSPLEEAAAAAPYLSFPVIPGMPFFIIDKPWYDAWRAYVSSPGAVRPPPIDVSHLVDPARSGVLRPGLCEGVHFEVVNGSLWGLLTGWYGFTQHPPVVLERRAIQVGVQREARVDVASIRVGVVDWEVWNRPTCTFGPASLVPSPPPPLPSSSSSLIVAASRSPCREFTFAPTQTCKEVRRAIAPWVSAAPHKIELELARGTCGNPQTALALTTERVPLPAAQCDSMTLAQVNVAEGDIFIVKKAPAHIAAFTPPATH